MNNNDLNENLITATIAKEEYAEKTYKIDIDKITSLEDVKEILGALNLGIKVKSNIMSVNGHDIDKLRKYLK